MMATKGKNDQGSAEPTEHDTHEDLPRYRQFSPHVVTIDELLSELVNHDIKVSKGQLEDWTVFGLLPRTKLKGDKKKAVPPGATDGIARALYPWWAFYVARDVFSALRGGRTVKQLQASTQQRIDEKRTAFQSCDEQQGVLPANAFDLEGIRGDVPVPLGLQRAAWAFARRYAAAQGAGDPKTIELFVGLKVETERHVFPAVWIPAAPEKRPHKRRAPA